MTNVPVARFVLDEGTGHVLTASLNRGALTKSLKSAKYADDIDACGYRISDLSEEVREFLVGADLLAKVKEINIFASRAMLLPFIMAGIAGAQRSSIACSLPTRWRSGDLRRNSLV